MFFGKNVSGVLSECYATSVYTTGGVAGVMLPIIHFTGGMVDGPPTLTHTGDNIPKICTLH
jgi:hypothetical protein